VNSSGQSLPKVCIILHSEAGFPSYSFFGISLFLKGRTCEHERGARRFRMIDGATVCTFEKALREEFSGGNAMKVCGKVVLGTGCRLRTNTDP